MADFTDLDWAFSCPASVTDGDLRTGFEILVARCQAEGAHLMSMTTPYQLLIERTITAYVRAKQLERREYSAPGKPTGGFEHAGQEKDFNIYVLKLLHELNDMMRKDHPTADAEFTMHKVKEILVSVVREIPDRAVQEDLSRRLAVAFDQHGM